MLLSWHETRQETSQSWHKFRLLLCLIKILCSSLYARIEDYKFQLRHFAVNTMFICGQFCVLGCKRYSEPFQIVLVNSPLLLLAVVGNWQLIFPAGRERKREKGSWGFCPYFSKMNQDAFMPVEVGLHKRKYIYVWEK